MTILDQINEHKRKEVEKRKQLVSIDELKTFPLYQQNVSSLSKNLISPKYSGIIAEHKRQSPSKGIINGNVNVQEVVLGYQNAGASAVSVLTDSKYFGGSIYDLTRAVEVLEIPVLRKDFIINTYQIHEAKALGAGIILLIAASLTAEKINTFAKLTRDLGMEVLFEIHDEEELKKVSKYVNVVGVNNRNLKTFEVDIQQSIKLSKLIPEQFIKISESGISNPENVKTLKEYGYQGFLMGENFMKNENPGLACNEFTQSIKEY